MSGMSRREMLRASAGAAAVAVPISALSAGGLAAAGQAGAGAAGAAEAAARSVGGESLANLEGPVMFCVHDVRAGEVSILHGADEVIVTDRQLVERIIQAAQARRAV